DREHPYDRPEGDQGKTEVTTKAVHGNAAKRLPSLPPHSIITGRIVLTISTYRFPTDRWYVGQWRLFGGLLMGLRPDPRGYLGLEGKTSAMRAMPRSGADEAADSIAGLIRIGVTTSRGRCARDVAARLEGGRQ